MYRLNMGGPKLAPQNDTLGRTWENDKKYLHVNGSAASVSVIPSIIKYIESVTPEIAPNWVYATAQTMGNANVANLDFNITWVLPVDPDFTYFVRAHFCDIVSTSLNTLVFNLFINSENAYPDIDLSTLIGNLDVPVYKDFVCNSSDNLSTLTVSIGPDSVADYQNAVLNGLEILKISNEARSLDGLTSVENFVLFPSKKTTKPGLVIGCVLAGLVAIVGLLLCYCFLVAKRSKTGNQKSSWLPLPLHGNSLTMTKVSTFSQKSGTASCISLASCNLGRTFMQEQDKGLVVEEWWMKLKMMVKMGGCRWCGMKKRWVVI
ncbi:putative non-specific serine/threonine protein kinase [Helianthus annuus]|uniref:Non-specific serine/threonine protein kinase n=2 Tax=Helianthus annuus TaxID=4232 RepID=A0A251USJ1_HELAN|nr:putative non-specific serine/threonine protein kinase [Helianthus annuus]KAJ0919824.1 putative non-specific serine/threonine protein kinase [Helianthus annuus]